MPNVCPDYEWFDDRSKYRNLPQWIGKDGKPKNRRGFYMDFFLSLNLMGLPRFLAASWDCVGIVSGHGRVRIGKTLSKDTKVKLLSEDGIINISKPLGEYKDGEILNTITVNPKTGETINTKAEVIKEVNDEEFYTLELEDGSKVECTMNHKFYVRSNGIIKVLPLKEIKEGDEIICLKK